VMVKKQFQKYEHFNLRCFPKKCPLKLRSVTQVGPFHMSF
jgi:hypothetical protein